VRRTQRQRRLLALLGILSLAAAWEIGALIAKQTAERPNVILPSIEFVFGTSLPALGSVDVRGASATLGTSATGTTTTTPAPAGQEQGSIDDEERAAAARSSYGEAFGVLVDHSLVTLRRVIVGTALGATIGVLLGLAIALSDITRRIVYPTVNFLRQIPLLALSILFLIWFGGAETGIYVYVAFGVATMLLINTINAVRNVPGVQYRYAETLGAGRLRIVRTVIFPAIVPELIGGVKVAVGLAWAMVLAAEYLGAQEGLGRLMLFSELFAFTGRMIVVALLFVLFAVAVHMLLTAVGNRLTRWVPRTG
jgi:ABC-type nitrate/sulfonate/bicarbonate transport system permease component